MNGIYIFLAPGFEPMEALVPMDVLRRARLDAKFVSLNNDLAVPSTQGYAITADLTWDEYLAESPEVAEDGCMVFPGGLPGAETLGRFEPLMARLRGHFAAGGLVAAICAAPAKVVAANLPVAGRKATVYEGFEEELKAAGAVCLPDGVVEDGNLITAKGPGLAMPFGFAVLRALTDERVCAVVKKAMML